ncbi:MAG: hypothetical protein R3310_10515 [Candidatus Competibacteraceae bacterium]|nr:hypothetical protein [Candidatus Competibacteraceae bacterium]
MIDLNAAKLDTLKGATLIYQGRPCRIIEVLEEGPALVLEELEGREIQANQYNEPNRRAPRIHSVGLLNVRRDGLNPLLEGLEALL